MIAIAVIGVGRMGSIHARNVASHERADLAAIADPATATALAVAAETGAPVRSVTEIMGDPAIDAVLIGASTDTHADLVEQAVAAGKAVLCEKPIDLDAARARRCVETVERAGGQLMVAFNRRFHPPFSDLVARLRSGEIGRLEILTIRSLDPTPPSPDYIARSGGIFRDMTIHDLDLARWLLDEPVVAVQAAGSCQIDPVIGAAGDWDSAVTTLRTAGGMLCQIVNSRRAVYGHGPRLELHGSAGRLSADNWTETREAQAGIHFQARFAHAYQAELDAFITALESGGALSPDGTDGLAALLLAEAATESALTGRTVTPAVA